MYLEQFQLSSALRTSGPTQCGSTGKLGDRITHRSKTGWKRAYFLFLLCAATAIASHAQTFTVLYNFAGTDGGYPRAALVQGADGNLYGTTYYGGGYINYVYCYASGCGTVFRITPQGMLTTLHIFAGPEGSHPSAALIQGADGNFYGTTYYGGANGSGTVFRITPGGTLTTLYSFCSQTNCTDGGYPEAGLVQGSDGNLYGTTYYGGNGFDNGFSDVGCGTVFRLTAGGSLTTLYTFTGADGCYALGGVIQAIDGNFYGTTYSGGANGGGTVFKITPGGALTTIYTFCSQTNCTDGNSPKAALVQGTDGNFYGTTAGGGAYIFGTVFKITPEGTLTTLHSFDMTDGANPGAGVIQATDGNFYGTTNSGGTYFPGTAFQITPGGTLTTLHGFGGNVDIQAGLTQGSDGGLYGTSLNDGAYNWGTVFRLDLGLAPPGEPSLSGKIVDSTGTLSLTLTNTGTGEATNMWINAITMRTLGGSGSVILTAPMLPFPVVNLAAGLSTTVPLSLTIPSTVTKFSITEAGTVQDLSGNTFSFSIGQVVFP